MKIPSIPRVAGTALGALLCLATLSAGQAVAAADSDAARKADEQAIREASAILARAFEKGDAKAVAAFWTEEGEYHSEDKDPIRGRAALEAAYTAFFAKRAEVTVKGKTDAVRFVAKDLAVEEGTISVTAKGGTAETSRYSSLYVKQGGKWLIAILKEWDDDATPNAKGIEDLAWLIGVWEGDGDAAKARTTYEWNETKTFIRVHYTIMPKKEKEATVSGMQFIGVLPSTGAIHSWTFDSSGGVGEAVWSWDGERWVIDSKGLTATGSATTATNFMKPSGKESFTWRSVERTLDGESLEDIGPITVKAVTAKK